MTKKKIRPGKNTEIEKIITTRKDAEKEERRENSYSLSKLLSQYWII